MDTEANAGHGAEGKLLGSAAKQKDHTRPGMYSLKPRTFVNTSH